MTLAVAVYSQAVLMTRRPAWRRRRYVLLFPLLSPREGALLSTAGALSPFLSSGHWLRPSDVGGTDDVFLVKERTDLALVEGQAPPPAEQVRSERAP
jgi:hypothetical protein